MTTIDVLLQGFSLGSDQGTFGFCSVTLIRGSQNTLVDVAHVGRRALLLQKLAERGLTPNDIDYVFLSHAHWDHALNVDVFPNAKILIHPKEREYVKDPKASDWATPRCTSMMLESQQLQEVREGEEIDDGVSVIETPGHSRGSMGLLVRGDDGTAAITGDAVANGWSASSGLPRLVFWDESEAKASIRKVLDRAQAFYPGHDRPFRLTDAGRIAYLQPTALHLFGWPEPGDGEGGLGLHYAAEPPYQSRIVG